MDPLRVLQVVTYMGRGGLETMLMNYYRHINREKVQFDFLVHRDFEADYDKEIRELGGMIYKVPKLNPVSIQYWKKEREFFLSHNYKIVHSHLDCMSAYPLKIAKDFDVPVRIAHAHNKNQDRNIKYPIKMISKRLIPNVATDLFACGEEAGRWMFGDNEFCVLKNAIDAEKYSFNTATRKSVIDEFCLHDKYIIGHVGRFDPQKNHEFLIDIFAAYHRKCKDSVLMLVGKGNGEDSIREKVKKLGIEESVIFLGLRKDVERILQAFDVFVFPSLYEGLPLTLIEAQAAGLPCIISDEVPNEAIVTNLVSVSSLKESPEKWAEKIDKTRCTVRKIQIEEIIKSGYDINDNAKRLQEYYIGKSGLHE